jgi:hypothetical protein
VAILDATNSTQERRNKVRQTHMLSYSMDAGFQVYCCFSNIMQQCSLLLPFCWGAGTMALLLWLEWSG